MFWITSPKFIFDFWRRTQLSDFINFQHTSSLMRLAMLVLSFSSLCFIIKSNLPSECSLSSKSRIQDYYSLSQLRSKKTSRSTYAFLKLLDLSTSSTEWVKKASSRSDFTVSTKLHIWCLRILGLRILQACFLVWKCTKFQERDRKFYTR